MLALKFFRTSGYPASAMSSRSAPSPARPWCFAFGAVAFVVVGCDAGGLLIAESKTDPADSGPPLVIEGKSSNEMVSSGTSAKSPKYQIVYTLGEPSPARAVQASDEHRHTGGVVGATSVER